MRFVKTLTQGIQVARTGVAIYHPQGGDVQEEMNCSGTSACAVYITAGREYELSLTDEFVRLILEFVLIDMEGF